MNSNVEQNGNTNGAVSAAPTSVATKIAIGGLLVGALGGLWFQGSQLASARQELVHQQQQTQQSIEQLSGQMQANVAASRTQTDETIAQMSQQVEKARKEAQAAAQRATSVATTAAKQQAAEVMTTLSAKNEELAGQVNQLKAENTEKSAKLDETLVGIKGEVGTVRTDLTTTQTDVASTRAELNNTIADLKRATGDMGVMSGLIATNSTELQALRRLGEKDYVAFTLPKKSGTTRVGEIQMKLKNADTKRNRFTVEVTADDKKVEKKDKGLNEPVQFYTAASRVPYEVVVNEIRKDVIVGYLAIPKVKILAQR